MLLNVGCCVLFVVAGVVNLCCCLLLLLFDCWCCFGVAIVDCLWYCALFVVLSAVRR